MTARATVDGTEKTYDETAEAWRVEEPEKQPGEFLRELTALLNRYSREGGSNTPDFILAEYLLRCLVAFDGAVTAREQWYGRGAVEVDDG